MPHAVSFLAHSAYSTHAAPAKPLASGTRRAALGLAAALLTTVAAGAGANPAPAPAGTESQGLKLALQIDVDGQRLASPTLWVQPGHDADITLHEQLRVAVRPQLDGERADLRLALHTWQDGAMVLRTSPRLVTPLGQSATLTWNDGQGRTLRLQVLATVAPRPLP